MVMRKYISMLLLLVLGILIWSVINDYFMNYVDDQTWTDSDRFWSVYSNAYRVEEWIYNIDKITYPICLVKEKNICIDLIQYKWSIVAYINSIAAPEDRMDLNFSWTIWQLNPLIDGRLQRYCTRIYESTVCYNNSSRWLIIMKIDDQMGIGFHWWEDYNARDVLEVIGY